MKTLIEEISDFAAEVGLSHHRVGILLVNNGRLIDRLKNGGRVWPETEREIRRNMATERKKRLVINDPLQNPALSAADCKGSLPAKKHVDASAVCQGASE